MADLMKLKKIFDKAKTTFEMAQELAQKRAALPVRQYGLGLPANNTAEQRAAIMFPNAGYHGSMRDIKKFDRNKADTESYAGRGTYITDSPEDASRNYANIYGPDVMGKVEQGMLQLGDDRNPIDRIAKGLQRKTLTPRQQEVLLSNTTGADNLGVVYPLRYRSEMPVHIDRPQAKEVSIGPFERYDEVNDEYIPTALSGKLNDALEEYKESGGDVNNILDVLSDYFTDSIPADKLYREIAKAAGRDNLSDPDTGEMISGGVAASDFLRHFGVDEIAHTPDFGNQQLNIGSQHTVSMNPENIRSSFAAFDPWRINSATAAAMGVAAPDLLANEPDKKAVGGLSKIGSLLRGLGQPASKAKPFYSAVDEAISKITQNKGNSDQFLAMIRNAPGVKSAEIADRNLKALLTGKGKMTKEQLQEIAAKNPAPQIVEREIGDKAFDARVEQITDGLVEDKIISYRQMGEDPKSAAYLAESEREDLFKQAHAKVMDEGEYEPQHQKWSSAGGKNYREILIKLPKGQNDYVAGHYADPNVLAHARVQDRTGPNGEKILHIEEIQSDWHQKGRKSGYQLPSEVTAPMDSEYRALVHKNADARSAGLQPDPQDVERAKYLEDALMRSDKSNIPDAPFKKNWHELVLKRLVDDAARNGYDKVVITTGAEQAKRYDLSKQVDQITARRLDDKYDLNVTGVNGELIYNGRYSPRITADEMEEIVGKEMTQKIVNNTAPESENRRSHIFNGLDLQVGGEGMKGFYDEMIPSSIKNMYGKHGVEVGTTNIPMPPKNSNELAEYTLRQEYLNGQATWNDILAANPRLAEEFNVPYHSFDITPQLRDSITNKGQPLYVAAPLGVAVDSALEQEEPAQQRKGGAVNQDAMNMAVWNKQLRKQHG